MQINNEYFSAETGAQITTISIHDSVTYISSSSFSRCSNLKSIYIPSGVNGINSGHFSSEVSRLIVYSDDYSIPSSWVLPSTYRIVCTSSLTEHYDAISFIKENPDLIYRGTTVVGAFDTSLTSIEIPSGIKFIGSHVFRDCYNLTKVTIPGSVITIKENAFFSHDNLTEVIIENYALTTIGDSAFESCEKLQSISKLPSTLTNVGNNAFAGCSSLGSVDMSETQVKTLGVGVFANCSALTTVELPTGLTSIPAMTFANSGLTSLDISTTSVTVIEIYAFYGCSSLTAIKLPTNVTCNYEIEPEGGSQWTEDQLESHLVSIGLGAFIGGVSGGVSGAVLGAIVAGVITAFNNNSNTTSSDRTVMTAFTGCSNLTIYTSKSSGTWCAKGETIGEGYCAISAYNSYPNQ